MLKKTIFILLAATFNFGWAQLTNQQAADSIQLNTITTAVPFLLIGPDSRHGAMGDAGVATSTDASAIHWNPSKLAFAEKDMALSLSYVPWLRKLVPDINLAYLSFYKKLDKEQTIGASLRYFSLGNITFTDNNGNSLGDFKPNEFALDVAYARKLSKKFAFGMAMRYIYSNLTSGISVSGSDTKPGQSFAVDVSATYRNPKTEIFGQDANFSAAINISNIGAKMAYTADANKDFLPTNLRLGQALEFILDDYNTITIVTDLNKLLVPTPPVYAVDETGSPILDPATGEPVIAKGKDPNVPVVQGIFQSFGDAPGGFKEELREINISGGVEYWYNKQFAVRAGYFHENAYKGNRKYFTAGLGLKLKVFGLDLSYLIPTTQQNPLSNTVRFTLRFDFDAFKEQQEAENN
jgi:hypothetical protein